jgi:hypothetical protein
MEEIPVKIGRTSNRSSSAGQTSIEFTMLVSILIIILLGTIYFNSTYWIQLTETKVENSAQSVCDTAATEINMAARAGGGFSRQFFLPTLVSDTYDYNLTVRSYVVYLNWTGGRTPVESIVVVSNLTGNLLKGRNMIRNVNGAILVN